MTSNRFFVSLVSVLASILTIFVFLTGYGNLSQFLPSPTTVPLVRTVLNNPGWINALVFFLSILAFSEFFGKRKRSKLRKISKIGKGTSNKEKNIGVLFRSIKEMDNKYNVYTNLVSSFLIFVVLIVIYNSDALTPSFCKINLSGDGSFMICVEEKARKRIAIKIDGSISSPNKASGLKKLLTSVSPIPDSYSIDIVDVEGDMIALSLPEHPAINIENFYVFFGSILVFVGIIYELKCSMIKMDLLVKISREVDFSDCGNRVIKLKDICENYTFRDSDVKSLTGKCLSIIETKSNK